jgi:alkylation response protein AidB-like acyl-CoA dehydrogenase
MAHDQQASVGMAQSDGGRNVTGAPATPPPPMTERMRSIIPEIAARAEQCEELRMVPPENAETLRRIGYLRAIVPRAYGGSEEEDLVDLYRAGRLLASACPSTAWSMQLLMGHSYLVAAFSKQAQDDVWGTSPDVVACSSFAAMGKFERVSGGIRVSGRYQFASGCDHADWAILGGHLANASTGEPEHCLAILHKSDYQMVDTWYAMGLKGSGSKDIVVENALVPEYRVESMGALLTGKSAGVGLHPGTLYRIPYSAMIGRGFSVVVVGAADGLVQVYTDRQRDRTSSITGLKAIDAMPSYMRLAESAHELYAATLMLEKDWAEFVAFATGKLELTPNTLAGWRTNQAFAVKLAVRATDRLYEASGGTAGYLKSAAQRYWRDVHMAASHYYVDYDLAARILGRHLMGLPPDRSLI